MNQAQQTGQLQSSLNAVGLGTVLSLDAQIILENGTIIEKPSYQPSIS